MTFPGGIIMKMGNRLLIVVLCLIMVLSIWATGCSSGGKQADVTQKNKTDKKEVQEKGNKVNDDGGIYPIVEEPLTLTIFAGLDAKVGATLSNYSEIACFKELADITGIELKWLHPPAGQDSEQFNLMISSMDLPDLIWWNWSSVAGGPIKMIEDGIIIPLNEHVDNYSTYFKALLEENDTVRKQTVLDDGTLHMFPMARLRRDRPEEWFKTNGWQIRKDWLDKVDLKIPTNMDEIYTVLKAFKNQDMNENGDSDDEIPLVAQGDGDLHGLAGAFGLLQGFYNDGGTVKYGPIEPNYKEYLSTLNKWYEEGLIDSEYAVTDADSFKAKITNEIGGVFKGNLSGHMGYFLNLMEDENAKFDLSGMPWPEAADGKAYTTQGDYNKIIPGSGTAITTKNEYIEESIKCLDFPYGEEGGLIFQFGIEGESYNMVDGYPTFTDIILNNPDGYTIDQSLSRYTMSTANFSVIKDSRYFEQTTLSTPQQQKSQEYWDPADKSLLLPSITLTSDESSRYSSVMSEINTYVEEMFTKFVMGKESFDNFDTFVNNIKKLKIEDAIQIQQDAVDRYDQR